MGKKELVSYLLAQNMTLSLSQVTISLMIAVLLSLLLYYIYRRTFSGIVYSKNFNITLILIAIVTTVAMIAIGNNLALSLGMVGSLSIIRFRTAIKEPRDIAFLFWAICIGLCCGANMYSIGFIGSLIISGLLLVFSKNIYDRTSYLVVIRGSTESLPIEEIEAILAEQTSIFRLRMSNKTSDSEELTYEIGFSVKKGQKPQSLQSKLVTLNTISSINLVSYNGETIG